LPILRLTGIVIKICFQNGFYENANATSLKIWLKSAEAVLGVKYLKAYLFMPTVWI
jgi:hypothetical protein